MLTITRLSSAVTLLILFVLSGPALWSDDQQHGQQACTFAGTWYGGGADAKYMLTIIANPGGNYTMLGYAGFTQVNLGYPVTTTFSNTIVKGPGKKWQFFGGGMVNQSASFPAPNPELWALHGTARLTDCSTLKLDYDFFGAYLMPTTKIPLMDKPDYVVVPPPFSETYQRLPTTCGQCPPESE